MDDFKKAFGRRTMLTGAAGLGLATLVGGTVVRAQDIPDSGDGTPTAEPEGTGTPSTLDDLRTVLPTVAGLIDSMGSQSGGQLYISLMGERIASYAFGRTGTGAFITPDSLVPWASATKPTTCLAIMRLADDGRLSIDDPVTDYIPEFGVNGKEDVLVRHLLTHTGHLGGYGGPTVVESFDETVTKIIEAPLEASRPGGGRSRRGGNDATAVAVASPVPGNDPSYNPAGIWILGEILRRIHDKPFDQIIRSEIFNPIGMTDSWNGMSADQFEAYGSRIVSGVGRINALQVQAETAGQSNPAGGGVGPIRELARIYEMMLDQGTIDGVRIIQRDTAAEMTELQATDGGIWTWGLGFALNLNGPASASTDSEATPTASTSVSSGENDALEQSNRYGVRASPEAFGHPGATGTIAFADPSYGLVFAAIGLPTSVADAVHDDLALG